MKTTVCVLLLLLFTVPAQASDVLGGGVLAQIVDGTYWHTTITLVNLSPATAAHYEIRFYGNSGQPLALDTSAGSGSAFSGMLGALASTVIQTAGTAPDGTEGFAIVLGDTAKSIGGQVTIQRTIPGLPVIETSYSMETFGPRRYIIPFDEVTGSTGLVLLNPNQFNLDVNHLTLTFRDQSGAVFDTQTITLGPLEHQSFMLADRFPLTAGRSGSVDIVDPELVFYNLGLRATTAGSVSAVDSLYLPVWRLLGQQF